MTASPGKRDGARDERERIVHAALSVAAERGYRDAALDQILTRSRLSAEVFARHFDSREDCLLAAWGLLADQCLGRFRRACENHEAWREGLRAGLIDSLRWMDKHPRECRFLIMDPLAVGGALEERRVELIDELARMLDAGRAEMDDAHALPATTADWVVRGLYDLVYRHVARRDERPLVEMFPDFMYFAAVPYIGPEAAREELRAGAQ